MPARSALVMRNERAPSRVGRECGSVGRREGDGGEEDDEKPPVDLKWFLSAQQFPSLRLKVIPSGFHQNIHLSEISTA